MGNMIDFDVTYYGFNKKYIEFCKPDHNIQKYITKAHFQHKISRFYLKYTS